MRFTWSSRSQGTDLNGLISKETGGKRRVNENAAQQPSSRRRPAALHAPAFAYAWSSAEMADARPLNIQPGVFPKKLEALG